MKMPASKELRFEVDTSLYPVEAIEAAGDFFSERAEVRVGGRVNGIVNVSLKPKSAAAAGDLDGEFHNELLHQALRRKVSQGNRIIRDFIVTKALLSAQQAATPVEASPQEESCPECRSAEPAVGQGQADAELEAEIEKLLEEIDKGDPGGDPLGVAVPWEEKFGKGKGKGKESGKGVGAVRKAPKKA